MAYVEPIFKGATRPATLWGVPTKPFVGVCFVCMVGFAAFQTITFVFLMPVLLFTLRTIAKTDDQIFRQMFLKCMTGAKAFRTRRYYRGLTAYGPADMSRK